MRNVNIRGAIVAWHVVAIAILLLILSLGRPTVGFPLNPLSIFSHHPSSRSTTTNTDVYNDGGKGKNSPSSSSSSRRGIVALSDKLLPTSDSGSQRRSSRTKESIRSDMNKKKKITTITTTSSTTTDRRWLPGKSQSLPSSSRRDQQLQVQDVSHKDSHPLVHSSNSNKYQTRRQMLASSIVSMILGTTFPESTNAAGFNNFLGRGKSSLYVVNTRAEINDQVRTEPVDTPIQSLSSEYALLEVLPVKNKIFRTLESKIESLSDLIGKKRKKRKQTMVLFVLAVV